MAVVLVCLGTAPPNLAQYLFMQYPAEFKAAGKVHVMVIIEEIIGKAVAIVHEAASIGAAKVVDIWEELLVDFVGVAFKVRR